MRRTLLVLVMFPALVFAQGVARVRPSTEQIVGTAQVGAAIAALTYGMARTPTDRPLLITQVWMYVHSASGGGAGTTVWRVSDGTNNCDATFSCAASQSTGALQGTLSGTCSFAAAKTLTISVSATGCTTTQPGVRNAIAIGRYL